METITETLSDDYYVIPDGVLIEILLRLPLPSLYLFKSVSKHWSSLITCEYFTRRLQKPKIDTPSGLFIRKDKIGYYFVTLGPKVTSFRLHSTVPEAGSHFDIMHSYHGFLLLRHYVSGTVYFHVYNPFTKLFKNIPVPRKLSHHNDIILAFDPTKSPHYKLVSLRRKHIAESLYYRIQVYSSKTGKWRKCGPLYPANLLEDFYEGLYWNNSIHWIRFSDKIHSKFDIVDYPVVTSIPIPDIDNVDRGDAKLFESRGSLLLLLRISRVRRYHVFEMRKESCEWLVKYILDDLDNIVPGRTESLFKHCRNIFCIILGERDDSFMVIKFDSKIVRYNFVSKTVSTLCNFTPYLISWSSFPFIASFAGV